MDHLVFLPTSASSFVTFIVFNLRDRNLVCGAMEHAQNILPRLGLPEVWINRNECSSNFEKSSLVQFSSDSYVCFFSLRYQLSVGCSGRCALRLQPLLSRSACSTVSQVLSVSVPLQRRLSDVNTYEAVIMQPQVRI